MHVDNAGELVAGVIGLQDELPIISCRQHEARRYQLEIARYCGYVLARLVRAHIPAAAKLFVFAG